MKKIFLILFLITLPTVLPFFNSQFFYTQDHIFIARLQQMSTALGDGQFPVRWAPDLRFGEPIFSFYAPLPFYLGSLIKLLGFNFIWVAKILFILSSFLSAVTMFILCRRLFSEKAAYLATILYLYAPYRAVDLFVRGALSETLAFIFFPLIFYTSFQLSEKFSLRNIIFLSLSLAGLFLTHNVTTLMFAPFLTLWWVYLSLRQKRWKIFLHFISSSILGFGLSAFFLLPALFERQLIQTKYLTVGYFDFRAHFVAFKQFFSTFWGYGSSLWGPVDDLSFQVGIVHWVILALAVGVGFKFLKDKKTFGLFSFLGISFFISLALQHNKSGFVWEIIPIMAFIQFPWRFLGISIFIVSLTGGALTQFLTNRFRILYFVLIVAAIIVNIGYFHPAKFVEDSFFDKFLNEESMNKGVELTKDYFPIWVKNEQPDYFGSPRATYGEIEVKDFVIKTGKAKGSINVLSDSEIEVPITYFPGWEVEANGKIVELAEPSIQGLISFKLPKGEYEIEARLKNTPVRTIGNMLSVISLGLMGYLLVSNRRNV